MINHEIHVLAGNARLNAQTVNNLNRKAFQSNVTSRSCTGGQYSDLKEKKMNMSIGSCVGTGRGIGVRGSPGERVSLGPDRPLLVTLGLPICRQT